MKITIYELAGLIKDCKAPKNIKYDGQIWELDCPTGDYFINGDLRIWLFQEYTQQRSLSGFLNDYVEIIEEDKKIEFEEIEELTCGTYDFEKQTINSLIKNQRKLIDEVNKLKEGK